MLNQSNDCGEQGGQLLTAEVVPFSIAVSNQRSADAEKFGGSWDSLQSIGDQFGLILNVHGLSPTYIEVAICLFLNLVLDFFKIFWDAQSWVARLNKKAAKSAVLQNPIGSPATARNPMQ